MLASVLSGPLACGDDASSSASGSSTSTGSGSTTTGASTSSGSSSSSSGAADTTSSTGSSSGTTGDSSGTTGEIQDPGCPSCILLAEGLVGGRGLSVHGDWVYFTDQDAGTVHRVPKGGGEIEELADLQQQPYDVVANDDHVFWTTFVEGGSVFRAVLPSGPAIPFSADDFPRMMQLVGDYVYWCAFDDIQGRVRRVLATGVGNPPETLVSVGNGVADLVVDNDVVYFTVHEPPLTKGLAPPGSVYSASASVPTDLLDLGLLANDQSEPWGIAIQGDIVYWLNGLGSPDDQPQSLVSTPAVGGSPLDVLVMDQTAPWGIATDAQYIYWTDYTEVKAVALAGGDPILLARMQTIARSIAVDDTDVFWITRERVLQRAKP